MSQLGNVSPAAFECAFHDRRAETHGLIIGQDPSESFAKWDTSRKSHTYAIVQSINFILE